MTYPKFYFVIFLMQSATLALAGRPLLVDDANTNESGNGHVEAWYDNKDKSFTAAPAYAPLEGLELGAMISKNNSTSENAYGLQFKKLLSASQESGCNTAVTLGRSFVQSSDDYSVYGWGILTCNAIQSGSVHMNFGLTKANTQSAKQLYGIAAEYPIFGYVPHIEWFHQHGEKSVLAVGIRTEIIEDLQIDGSYRIQDSEPFFTIGLKFQF